MKKILTIVFAVVLFGCKGQKETGYYGSQSDGSKFQINGCLYNEGFSFKGCDTMLCWTGDGGGGGGVIRGAEIGYVRFDSGNIYTKRFGDTTWKKIKK